MSTEFSAPVDDVSFKWHPTLYKLITFGHAPAAVDWLLIRFLGTDTIEHVVPGTRAKVFHYLDLATDLDPAFFRLYTTGPTFLAVVRNDAEGARIIAQKGENYRKEVLPSQPPEMHRVWDLPWRVPLNLGYIYLFELKDLKKAAAAYAELDAYPDIPPVMRQLSRRFATPAGPYEVGMKVLSTMIAQAKDDPRLEEELIKKRNSLFISLYLFQLNSSFEEYMAKQPKYLGRLHISRKDLEKHWRTFANARRVPDRDEWGGRIFLDQNGRIETTTPRLEVMGMR